MSETDGLASTEWLTSRDVENLEPITKATEDTSAWFATVVGRHSFLKFYPSPLDDTRGAVEVAIAGANLHPAIVPIRQAISCVDGVLLVYDRVSGVSLDAMETRRRFQLLPLSERVQAITTIFGALAAIADADFMIVDWYEGNMIYDFERQQIWLFDWELCRSGGGFTLEMDNNYGSSRLMAPEEFLRGSWLDQRTLVFNLGRYALLTVPELAEPLAPILARATHPARAERYASLREFTRAFVAALASLPPALAISTS